MLELILKDLNSSNSNFNYVSLRYFNVAGAYEGFDWGEAHQNETHLIPKILDSVIDDQPVTVFGSDYETPDGTCIRDYIHLADLCSAHEKALNFLIENKRSEVFNLGTGMGYSIMEIIQTVREVTKKEVSLIQG